MKPRAQTLHFVCPELSLVRTKPLGYEAWVVFRRLFMRIALDPVRPNYIMHGSAVCSGDLDKTAGLIDEALRKG